MFSYNLLTKPNFDINKKTIDEIFKVISNIIPKDQNGAINIVFLDDDSIKNLNKKYRKIDKNTDVLSFAYYDLFSNFSKNDIIGEIVMSEKKIISQGKDYGLGSEKEFYKLLIHSVLHILGYDHETDKQFAIMAPLERDIWEKVFS